MGLGVVLGMWTPFYHLAEAVMGRLVADPGTVAQGLAVLVVRVTLVAGADGADSQGGQPGHTTTQAASAILDDP